MSRRPPRSAPTLCRCARGLRAPPDYVTARARVAPGVVSGARSEESGAGSDRTGSPGANRLGRWGEAQCPRPRDPRASSSPRRSVPALQSGPPPPPLGSRPSPQVPAGRPPAALRSPGPRPPARACAARAAARTDGSARRAAVLPGAGPLQPRRGGRVFPRPPSSPRGGGRPAPCAPRRAALCAERFPTAGPRRRAPGGAGRAAPCPRLPLDGRRDGAAHGTRAAPALQRRRGRGRRGSDL